MPGILAYYDPNDRALNDAGEKERRERAAMIDSMWAYYTGDHVRPLKVQPDERDDNVIINLCSRTVDKTVEMVGTPARAEIPGGAREVAGSFEAAVSPQQALVDTLLDAYRDDIPDIITSGMIAGHVFLKLSWTDNEPAANLLDPRLVTAFWDATQPKRTLFWRIEWAVGEQTFRQDIVRADVVQDEVAARLGIQRGAPWLVLEYARDRDGQYVLRSQDAWGYDFPPIVDGHNKRRPHSYYGVTHLVAAPLNDTVNFIASNTARILKFHAHPRTIGVGVPVNDVLPTRIDGFFSVPAGSEVFNLEMQSDLRSSLDYLRLITSEFFASARVVDTASIRDKLGQITNFGVRMLFADMLEMIEEKRAAYGRLIAEMLRRLASMRMGAPVPMPRCVWPDALPTNRLELVQMAQIEAGLGVVSKQTLADDLGRDYQRERQRMDEESAEASDALANMLAAVGQRGGF